MVRISNIALATGLLVSVGCLGMGKSLEQDTAKIVAERIASWNAKSPMEKEEYTRIYNSNAHERAEQATKSLNRHIDPSGIKGKNTDGSLIYADENLLHSQNIQRMKEEEAEFILKQTKTTKQHKKDKITKIPTPKQITLISKEIVKSEIDAFRAKNIVPTVAIVPSLSIFNNPSIRQVEEIGSYTLFESENEKWIVDENGLDTGLSTKAIQKMIDHDCLDETQVENNIFTMKH